MASENNSIKQELSHFEKLPFDHQKELLSYSFKSYGLLKGSINKCDTKSGLHITFISSTFILYYYWIANQLLSTQYQIIVFYVNLLLSITILILCFSVLNVRKTVTPPNMKELLNWLKGIDEKDAKRFLFPVILYQVGEAEIKNYSIMKKKADILQISQLLIFIYMFTVLTQILLFIKL